METSRRPIGPSPRGTGGPKSKSVSHHDLALLCTHFHAHAICLCIVFESSYLLPELSPGSSHRIYVVCTAEVTGNSDDNIGCAGEILKGLKHIILVEAIEECW